MRNNPQPSVDRAQRCPRCFIGPRECQAGTPLSMKYVGEEIVIFCPKCGYIKPDESDSLKKTDHPGDVTGGTNEPEKWETPC